MKRDMRTQIKKANAALLERGEVTAIESFFAPDYLVHVTGKDLEGGHDMIRHIVDMYHHAFSGIEADVEILAKEGNRVSWQRTIRAKHRGAFKGFPATNRRLVWREMITSRFEKNLIVEEWYITDLAEQLLLARKSLKK